MGLLVLFDYFKGKELQILFNRFIVPRSTNQTFGIKNSVFWIRGQLIFCSITNQSFPFWSESHVRGSDSVSLVVSDDFNSSVLKDTNTVKTQSSSGLSKIIEVNSDAKNLKNSHHHNANNLINQVWNGRTRTSSKKNQGNYGFYFTKCQRNNLKRL